MQVDAILKTLLHGNQLKRTARTGWVQRGVPDAEDVAAHSYGVAFATLIIGQSLSEPLDISKALAIAVLHDLPESLTGDITTPAWRFIPEKSKEIAERNVMEAITDDLGIGKDLFLLWDEYNSESSVEARLVHDADRIDLYLQAMVYERQFGNKFLAEFWENKPVFHFQISQQIYDLIRRRRTDMSNDTR